MPEPRSQSISPSPFVIEWLDEIAGRVPAPGRALDLAMGSGRHALCVARKGLRTYGVDINLAALRSATRHAEADRLMLRCWCADLTTFPLPVGRFELVIVTRYLQRDLFPSIRRAIAPGGFLLYETFTIDQRAHGVGPSSADHLLERGELREAFRGLDVLFYQEVQAPEAVARLVARKTMSRI
jgi:SAM-dependent methyltransferase